MGVKNANRATLCVWEEVGGRGREVTPQAEKRWCCGTGGSGGEGVWRETRQLAIEEVSESVFIVILS